MNLFYSIDPATEDIIFEHHVTAYSEIDVCINKAFENKMVWQQTTVEQRIGFVRAFQTCWSLNLVFLWFLKILEGLERSGSLLG